MRRTCSLLRAAGVAASIGIVSSAQSQPVSHDFNNDGTNDYPVTITGHSLTDPVTGAARIWSGASKTVLQTTVSPDTNTLFGWSYASAGDINADGHDDLIVGEPLWNPSGSYEGRIKVFSGADGTQLLSINGPYAESAIGRYVAGLGDWNGDGTPDIAASGWDIADTDSDGVGDDAIGIVYVFSGANGSVLAEITDPGATTLFGYCVFGIGDITGDGYADIIVTDPHATSMPGSGIEGELYIFEGRAAASNLTISDAHRILSNTDVDVRTYAVQVDVMHPDVWLIEPTLQVISLIGGGEMGGVNESSSRIDLIETSGVIVGTKGARSSLVLAGDVNLDGKVDAQDLQVSISQLGTNPQALGVMPIADMNNDQVVDSTDVALLLGGYGQATDIYEGLWDGSRLLSVVAGNSGFGSLSGGNISGGGSSTRGPRPIGTDCLRSIVPPDFGPTLVRPLLRADAREDCNSCPDCGSTSAAGCYECDREGQVTGGEINVSPSQPEPEEAVTFTISPWEINGRKTKCISACGSDQKLCSVEVSDIQPYWVLERKNPNGDWIEIGNGNDPTVTHTEGSCAEVRLRLPERVLLDAEIGLQYECDELRSIENEKVVQWADFKISVKAAASWPANQDRSTFGPLEVAELHLEPTSVAITSLDWAVDFIASSVEVMDAPDHGLAVGVPGETGTYTVTVSSLANPDCKRVVKLEVIPPSSLTYSLDFDSNLASSSCGNAVQVLKAKVGPDSVNFDGIKIREGMSTPANATGAFDYQNGAVHMPSLQWLEIGATGNEAIGRDGSGKVARPELDGTFRPGNFSWTIDVLWAPTGISVTGGDLFATKTTTATVDAAGRVCVTKGEVGPACKNLGQGGPALPSNLINTINVLCTGN